MIFQRHQIPLTVDTLQREINRTDLDMEFSLDENAKPRDVRKLKKDFARKKNLRGKFEKKTQKFLEEFEKIECLIKQLILNFDVQELALSFGISCTSPKEVYLIQIPDDFSEDDESMSKDVKKRRIMKLFNVVLDHDELFQRISSEFSLTNMFIGFKINPKEESLPGNRLDFVLSL